MQATGRLAGPLSVPVRTRLDMRIPVNAAVEAEVAPYLQTAPKAVAAAKRLVRGTVGIDAEAGPTEIAILADATADLSGTRAKDVEAYLPLLPFRSE